MKRSLLNPFGRAVQADLFNLRAVHAQPYTSSAAIYDHMMREVDYLSWASYLLRLLRLAGIDTRRSRLKKMKLCELACGTGNVSRLMAGAGFKVTGVDSSEEMLEVARSKIRKTARNRPRYIHHNMVQFRSDESFDIEVCVYDSINYIQSRSMLAEFFKNAYRNLKNGGAFIFDASLESNSLNDQNLFTQKGRHKRIEYERRSSYDKATKIHTTLVRVMKDKKVFEEIHEEHVYNLDLIRTLFTNAGFTERIAVGDFTTMAADDKTERVHFVVVK